MKRVLVLVIVIGLAVGGFLAVRAWRRSGQTAALAGLQTEAVTRGSLTATVGATGTVRPKQRALLAFQTIGRVEETYVKVGEAVEEGTVVARLSQSSLSPQVIMAQADLVAAQNALEDLLLSSRAPAQAALALAQARDALKDSQYRRAVQQEGHRASRDTIAAAEANLVLAQEEVEQAQAQYNALSGSPEDDPLRALALSNLAAARQRRDAILRQLNWYKGKPTELDQALLEAEVALAEANLAEAEREWERLKDGTDPDDITAAETRVAAAQATIDLAQIKAPFRGTITSVLVKPGDLVTPGQVALELTDLSRLLVDVEVSEVDINKILPGQAVDVTFDAILDRTYEGEVIEVGMTGAAVQGVVNFRVTVELMEPDESVKVGLTAGVNIVVRQIEDVLLVPNRAVRVRDGQRVVYVMRQGIPELEAIQLGASSELFSQVIEGEVNEGDLVVLNPPAEIERFMPPGFVRRR